MNTTIKTGDLITWTPWSPMDTDLNSQDFMAFINEKTEIEVDDAFIKGGYRCLDTKSMDAEAYSQIKAGRITFE